jgi:hypothetical protein
MSRAVRPGENRGVWWKLIIVGLLLICLGLFMVAAGTGKSHADMCGPSNLPIVSSLNPYVKGCQVWAPFTGNAIPQIPVPQNPGTAPAPIPGFGGGGGWLGPQPPTGYTPFP